MDWYFSTPSGQEYFVDAVDWSLDRVLDASRPSEGKITVPRSITALKKCFVRAEEDGQTKFLGFISRKPSISGSKKQVEMRGVEALLWHRRLGNYGYMAKVAEWPFTRLQHIFSSSTPGQAYDRWQQKGNIGLIWFANSKMPPGRGLFSQRYTSTECPWGVEPAGLQALGPWQLFNYDNYIYKFPGGGSNSRIGNASIYMNGSLMTEVSSYANLVASAALSCYRDTQDLYIKILEAGNLYLGELNNDFFAANAFDTKVRLGTLDNYDTVLDAPFRIGHNDIPGDILLGIAEVHGLNVRWRYSNDGYCYMDVLDDFSDDGLFDILEVECEKIDYEQSSELEPDSIMGLGNGSQHVRQVMSYCDLTPGMAYIESSEEFDGGFSDARGSLFNLVRAKWDSIQRGEIIKVESSKYEHLLPGNPCRVILSDEISDEVAVHKISRRAGKPASISLGGREFDIIDAVRAKRSVGNAYQSQSLYALTYGGSNSGTMVIGDLDTADTPYTVPGPLTIPAYDANDLPRWLIDVSLKAPSTVYARTPICTFWVCVHTDTTDIDSWAVPSGATQWYQLGETVQGIDLSEFAVWGTGNYVRIHCRFRGYWADTPPTVDVSVDSKIYARRRI